MGEKNAPVLPGSVEDAARVISTDRLSRTREPVESFAKYVLKPTDHVALEAMTNCWPIAALLIREAAGPRGVRRNPGPLGNFFRRFKKRKGGPGKGQNGVAKRPGGGRTIKSLDRVYGEEGLPQRKQELPPGERQMLKATGCEQFAESLASDRVVPGKSAQTSC